MKKSLNYIFTLVLCLSAYFWWAKGYDAFISYHEQLQMFLCSSDYFFERIALPGGLSDYISEFIVSFFFYAPIGAGFIAALLVLIQLLSWALIKRQANTDLGFALSFVPAMFVWMALTNPNVLFSLPVSIIGTLILCLCYRSDKGTISNGIVTVIVIPLCYWLFGTAVYLIPLYLILLAIAEKKYADAGLACLYTILIVGFSTRMLDYPVYRVLSGLNYYRYPTAIPVFSLFLPMVLAAVLPFMAKAMASIKLFSGRNEWKSLTAFCLIICGACYGLVSTSVDPAMKEQIEYDYLVRGSQWNKIIDKANKKTPDTPLTVVCLNLALSQTGQMPNRMFNYFQNGIEGLFQPMLKDCFTPIPTAETFLKLGMVNEAQEYFFEAQEAIPNYRKSARFTRRLVMTNLINGQYEVAAKYLRMLKKTLFYSAWAEDAEKLLNNEEAIDNHPIYGEARRNTYTDDFLISDREMDNMLGLLLVKNPRNKMAYEYLMSYIILRRDLEHFYEYFQLGSKLGYKEAPQIYQDVHSFLEAQKLKDERMYNQYKNTPTWRYLLRQN